MAATESRMARLSRAAAVLFVIGWVSTAFPVLALPDALCILFRVILVPSQFLHHKVHFPAYPVAGLRRCGQGCHVYRQRPGMALRALRTA